MNRSIKDLGKVIWKKKIYIILITIIFAITGVSYTLTNVKYVATNKILLGTSENTNLMETYKELIKSSTVLEKVIKNTKSDITITDLYNLIEVNTIDDTNMIEIRVAGENPEQIQNFSNEISKVLINTVNEIYGNKDLYNVDTNVTYYNNNSIAIIAIATAIAGFFLSTLFFVLCSILDTKVKCGKDIEAITGLKSLICIPNIKMISKKKLNIKNIRAHKSEVFKTLMTNIQFLNINNVQSKSILITSSMPLEGKTYVANNLAIEFAKAGKKVIIIDADMRRGRIAKIFNLPIDLGFSNYLANLDANGNIIHERITRFIKDTEIKNLNVITSGNIPPNPTELLITNKVEELIKDLKVFYDVIIFDGVAVLEAPETSILSKSCDLTLILSAYGNTKKENLAIAYKEISSTDGSVVGVAFNKIPERKLKKKFLIFKNNLKQKINNIFKKIKDFFKNLGQVCLNIVNGIKSVLGIVIIAIMNIKKIIANFINKLKSKSQDVKEYIKNYKSKKEKIKLIEAGSIREEDSETLEKNNIIKEIFNDEISKLESSHEVEFKKKLDEMKNNIDEKTKKNNEIYLEEKPKVRLSNSNSNTTVKSKFDLMLKQQEELGVQKEAEKKQEKLSEINENELIEQKEIEKQEQIIAKQKMEKEKKEEEKRLRQEIIENYEEIDFSKQEVITEEMIRRQVEMDEMIRLAEKEEEEETLKIKQMKLKEKAMKRNQQKESFRKFKDEKIDQFQNFINLIKTKKGEQTIKKSEKQAVLLEERIRKNEVKMEEKIKRANERNENKARIAKVKEEKRAYREMEKQKHKEELRIQGELQEDNLYPKPRM